MADPSSPEPTRTTTTSEPSSLGATLVRWGGFLLQPRRQAARTPAAAGGHDALWLVLLYAVATQVRPWGRAVASLLATGDGTGWMMLAAAIGRGLLVPIVVLVVAEAILGRDRAHRRAVVLLPLVVVASVDRWLGGGGSPWPASIAGAVLGLGWVAWIRRAVPPLASSSEAEAGG